MEIIVKYHDPLFSKNEVLDYFKFDKYPRNLKRKAIDWMAIKKFLSEGSCRPKRLKNYSYLLWVISPEFYLTRYGLFLTDFGKHFKVSKEGKKRGKFLNEGLVNHIHLDYLISNRIAQFELGVRAICAWLPALLAMKNVNKCVVYLNGPNNFTLCLYSDPTDFEINQLDQILPMGSKLIASNAQKFINWAL